MSKDNNVMITQVIHFCTCNVLFCAHTLFAKYIHMYSGFKYLHNRLGKYHDVHLNIMMVFTPRNIPSNISKHCSKVKPEASEAELKKAYRKLAMK